MRTLSRHARDAAPERQLLPDVFPGWRDDGIRFRRGSVAMLAGTPGSLKTLLALHIVHAIGAPTLYFSADTDPDTMLIRAAAMLTGDRQSEISAALGTETGDYYTSALGKLDHVAWCWETDPTYRDLDYETAAFAEVAGSVPSVIVVDNLMNVLGQNEDEWASMRDTTRALHRLTRMTNALVLVTHHMSEHRISNGNPAPRSELQGKVSQLPELILSLGFDGIHRLRIAAVKNRFGPADASARMARDLWVDPSRCLFRETPPLSDDAVTLTP